MNRPIKFRFWDKSVGKFTDFGAIHIDGDIMTRSATFGGLYDFVSDEMEENIVVQQYTGLKDRSGTEIYEGDIVRLNTGAVGFYEYSEPHLAFAVRLKEPDCSSDDFIISKLDGWHNLDVKVIGNVYENPELLDEKNT